MESIMNSYFPAGVDNPCMYWCLHSANPLFLGMTFPIEVISGGSFNKISCVGLKIPICPVCVAIVRGSSRPVAKLRLGVCCVAAFAQVIGDGLGERGGPSSLDGKKQANKMVSKLFLNWRVRDARVAF